jgi:Ion channel
MAPAPTVLCTAAGVALIGIAARDVFDALFHPEGRGTVSRALARSTWRAARGRPPLRPLAGPLALVAVITAWAAMLSAGWALVFLPHVDEGFRPTSVAPSASPDAVEALNLSLVTLTTLGSADLAPEANWLHLVTPLEALLGFGLLSASISWVLLIYPVLSRRRSLAYETFLLRRAERDAGVALERADAAAGEQMLAELTSRLVAVERDMVSFPVTYYFAESDPRFALSAGAADLLRLARRGTEDDMPANVRLRAEMLLEALGDFAATTATRFHGRGGDDLDEALAAYARDHGHEPGGD